MHSTDQPDLPARIMGHRGIPSLAPENTLGGFRKAAQLGISWVELDVSLLADDTPVVCHDPVLLLEDRGTVPLAHLTRDQLVDINMARHHPDWPHEPLPLLQDVLSLLKALGIGVNLELKDYGAPPERLARCVQAELQASAFPSPRVLISSFSDAILAACREQMPDIRRGLLVDDLPLDWQQRARDLALFSLHVDWRHLNQARTRAIKDAGLHLYCWTANSPDDIASLWHWGLDGVMTDHPQRFMSPPAPAALDAPATGVDSPGRMADSGVPIA